MAAINNETREIPRSNSRWMALLTILALALSIVSIVLTRDALERQAALADEHAKLRSELEKAHVPQPTPPIVESSPKEFRTIATIRLVREPVDISGELLQTEIEQVTSDLQNQFPKLPDALHVVAMMKAQTRQYSDAQKLWEECIRLAPKQEHHHLLESHRRRRDIHRKLCGERRRHEQQRERAVAVDDA